MSALHRERTGRSGFHSYANADLPLRLENGSVEAGFLGSLFAMIGLKYHSNFIL
jgi:hypothetical protein